MDVLKTKDFSKSAEQDWLSQFAKNRQADWANTRQEQMDWQRAHGEPSAPRSLWWMLKNAGTEGMADFADELPQYKHQKNTDEKRDALYESEMKRAKQGQPASSQWLQLMHLGSLPK